MGFLDGDKALSAGLSSFHLTGGKSIVACSSCDTFIILLAYHVQSTIFMPLRLVAQRRKHMFGPMALI